MYFDTYRLATLRIEGSLRDAALERSLRPVEAPFGPTAIASLTLAEDARRASVAVPGTGHAADPGLASPPRAQDAALVAAGERSDALLSAGCGSCATEERAA